MGSYNGKRSLSHKALRLTEIPPIDEKKKNVKMGTSSPVILPHQTGLIGTAGMADCTPLKKADAMLRHSGKITAFYCRLSHSSGLTDDGNRMVNQ